MTREGIFGWSYPPGCSSTPYDEFHPCEDCELWNEIGNRCIASPTLKEYDEPDMDWCPKHGHVKECPECKKPVNKMRAMIPKEFWGYSIGDGSTPCCSKECADKLSESSYKFEEEMRVEKEPY